MTSPPCNPSESVPQTTAAAGSTPVTVIAPCFNEAEGATFLVQRLLALRGELLPYATRFVLVDDGSTDNSLAELRRLTAGHAEFQVVAHETNQGITAAILTGLRSSETELVCSIDSDCSYDPAQLAKLLDMLQGGFDMVTASPYHPLGAVQNVPRWRLLISRSCSWMYSRVLETRLFTYTSCFRAYRRPALVELKIDREGFVGLVEMIRRLEEQGGKIGECPAVLDVRRYGQSKLRTVSVALQHLRFMWYVVGMRLRRFRSPNPNRTQRGTLNSSVAR